MEYQEKAPVNCSTRDINLGDTDIILELSDLSSKKFRKESEIDIRLQWWKQISDYYRESGVKNLVETIRAYCGKYALVHYCDAGHRIGKRIYCQSEFCPICGEPHSQAHNRRASRLVPYVLSFDSVGYFVFTLPGEVRDIFLSSKKYKSKIQRGIKKILKKFQINYYVARWHWFGDPQDNDEKTKDMIFHPHLNILADGSYIKKDDIEKIRLLYTRLINRIFKRNFSVCDFQYRYYPIFRENINQHRRAVNRIFHKIFYITKPTIRNYLNTQNPDEKLIMRLYNYLYMTKNTYIVGSRKFDISRGEETAKAYSVYFEYWRDQQHKKSDEEIQKILATDEILKAFQKDKCICGAPLIWKQIEKITGLEAQSEIGSGIMMLENCTISKLNNLRQKQVFKKLWESEIESPEYRNYLENIAISSQIDENPEFLQSRKSKSIQLEFEI